MGTLAKRVGIMLPQEDEFALRLLEGAIRYADQHPGIQLVVFDYPLHHRPDWLDRPLDCHGLLLRIPPTERWAVRLFRAGVPAVSTVSGWPLRWAPVIAFSVAECIRVALDHLEKLQPATMVVLQDNVANNAVYRERERLFVQLAAERKFQAVTFDLGLQPGLDHQPPHLTRRGRQRLVAFLRALPLPAAVWARIDVLAQVTLDAVEAAGLRVPDQLAVLGTGNFRESHFCRPSLSSIPAPGDLIGFEAMRVLDAMMAGQSPAQRHIAIAPPPVIARESTRGAQPTDAQLEQAHQFIVEHACQGITVDEVLRLLPFSLPTFHKRFAAKYGRTPGAEIRRLRTEQARYYLQTTTLTITRVGQLCGYDQHSKFANFFKRETGLTPSEYRRLTHGSKASRLRRSRG